jgi:hypothetical protein
LKCLAHRLADLGDQHLAVGVCRLSRPHRIVFPDHLHLAGHIADRPLRDVGDHDHVHQLAFVLRQHLSLRSVDLSHRDLNLVCLLALLEPRLIGELDALKVELPQRCGSGQERADNRQPAQRVTHEPKRRGISSATPEIRALMTATAHFQPEVPAV